MALAGLVAAPVVAQQIKLDLDALAAKASNKVNISLNASTLALAAPFLDDKDADEAKVKKMLSGLEGIYVRAFEFKQTNAWTQADLDGVRNQLKAPEWSRMVGVESGEDGETADVFIRTENKKVTGLVVLAAGPKEFAVVNIVGPIDPAQLAELGGNFGVPKLKTTTPKESGKKEE
jgi:hypothetical protein